MRSYLSAFFLLAFIFSARADAQTTPIQLFNNESIELQSENATRNASGTTVGMRIAQLNSSAVENLISALMVRPENLPAILLPSVNHQTERQHEYKIRLHEQTSTDEWVLIGEQVANTYSTLVLTVKARDGISLTARNESGSMTILKKEGVAYVIKSTVGIPAGHDPNETQRQSTTPRKSGSGTTQSPTSVRSTSNVVDLLVVTTADAAAKAGGTTLLNQSIEAAVADTNVSFASSGVDLEINLAHIAATTYVETNNTATDHNRLQNTNDGFLDDVHDLRNQHSADLVMLVIGEGDSFCGRAGWGTNGLTLLPQFGFSVITEYCISTTVFAHELGHNFGLQHDRFVDNTGGYLPYAHGFTTPSESWFTIMAYPVGCNYNCAPLNRWSNPSQQLEGETLGVPIGQPDAADNVSALNVTKSDVIGFRAAADNTTAELNVHTSCLAGSGRVDVNIVNTTTNSSVYRLEFQGLSARELTIPSDTWARFRLTGRAPGTYSVTVKRDNFTVLSTSVDIDCSQANPLVSSPEITPLSACTGGNGLVLFQMVNPTNTTRPYIIEFEGVPNRSTSATLFGQSIRGVSGRPDGSYDYTIRTGSTVLETGQVSVHCD